MEKPTGLGWRKKLAGMNNDPRSGCDVFFRDRSDP